MKHLVAAMLLALAACGRSEPVVINGSSQERFEKSTEKARRDIPDADRLVFDRAIRTVQGRSHSSTDAEALARVTFDGMTAEQVVADQKARDQ